MIIEGDHARSQAATPQKAQSGDNTNMLRKLLDKVRGFGAHEQAQDVVEYAMLIAAIAVVVLLGIAMFGNEIRPWFEQLAGRITTVGT